MSDPVQEVVEYARELHHGEFRRDGKTPYFVHIERIIEKIRRDYAYDTVKSRKLIQIAALHDTIEGGKISASDLQKLPLLPDVYTSVLTLTKDKWDDYLDYINQVKQDHLARIVKRYDILDNITDDPTEKQMVKYVKALALLLGING